MKIIFICKYNVFRSRIAEEYFNKINKNKSVKAISRGLIMEAKPDFEEVDVPKKILGINILGKKPHPITKQELKDADLILIVANDIPKVIFNYHNGELYPKIKVWNIEDEHNANRKNIKRITLKIKEKIEKLVRDLG